MELHERQKTGPQRGRAPLSLKETHFLGKAPQLITADGRIIVESTAIAKYLIDTYDKEGKFQGDEKNDIYRDEQLCSHAGTSIMPWMIVYLLFDGMIQLSPFFIRPLFSLLRYGLHTQVLEKEMKLNWQYVNDQLGDQDYLMGTSPGRADFIMSWPADFCIAQNHIDLKDYPKLEAWYRRCEARDAWKRSLEKGNGYDLSFKL